MDGWDISILAIAGFFAVNMLARMMGQHREATLARLRREFEREQQRLAEERQKQQRAEKKRKKLEEKQKYLAELQEKQRRARAA